MQEYKNSENGYFVTLTYDTEHLPFTPDGQQTISKRDVQLFMKRLRKCNRKTTIKYYAVGEYGGRFKRPHYHALLFNVDAATIDGAWQNGTVHIGYVEEASVGYTLKYMSKTSKIGLSRWDDRQPQFALMSKGLGKSYLTRNTIMWHLADLPSRMCHILEDGKKIGMPRYYKDKLYIQKDREIIADILLQAQLDQLLKMALKSNDPARDYRGKKEAIKASARRMEFLIKN